MLKKVLISTAFLGLTCIGFATTANAAADGIYVNGQLGYGNTNYSSSNLFASSAINSNVGSTGLAGRVALGYQFNPNIAAELGYIKFSNTSVDNITAGNINFGNGSVSEYAVDLVAKGILPLGTSGFALFGTLGGAYLNGSANLNNVPSSSSSKSNFWPTFGVGASYDITNNLPVTVAYQRIQQVGNSSSLQSTDFIGLGLEWHFG